MKSLPLEPRLNLEELNRLITSVPGGVHLVVRVIPRAARTQIAGIRRGALLVRLAAPPVEGAANEALISFIATVFDVRRRAVTLLSGERRRDKRLAISGITPERIRESLEQLSVVSSQFKKNGKRSENGGLLLRTEN